LVAKEITTAGYQALAELRTSFASSSWEGDAVAARCGPRAAAVVFLLALPGSEGTEATIRTLADGCAEASPARGAGRQAGGPWLRAPEPAAGTTAGARWCAFARGEKLLVEGGAETHRRVALGGAALVNAISALLQLAALSPGKKQTRGSSKQSKNAS